MKDICLYLRRQPRFNGFINHPVFVNETIFILKKMDTLGVHKEREAFGYVIR